MSNPQERARVADRARTLINVLDKAAQILYFDTAKDTQDDRALLIGRWLASHDLDEARAQLSRAHQDVAATFVRELASMDPQSLLSTWEMAAEVFAMSRPGGRCQ